MTHALAVMDDLAKEQAAIIAELRAILAPLLENPWRDGGDIGDGDQATDCLFCGPQSRIGGTHAPDCPVLRKDALLGHQ